MRRPPSSFGYRGWDDHRLVTPLLARFIILSILLHILGILLFGAPSGGSRQGHAMWGSLDVMLADSYREPGPALKMERGLALPGLAPRAERPAAPPAARRTPAPPTAPATPAPPAPAATAPVETPEPAIVSTPAEAPVIVPRLLDRVATPRPSVEMEPAFQVPPPTPAPIETGAPIETVATPRIDRSMAAPPVLDAPLVQPAPALAPIPMPSVDRQLAAPPVLDAPLVQPAPDLAPIAPPRIERQLAEPPAIAAPVEQPLPAPPAPPAERAAPQEVPTVPKIERVAPEALPTPAAREMQRAAPAATEEPAKPPAPPAPGPPARPFPKGEAEPRFPAARERSTYDPTAPVAPKLDLDAIGKRAGELAREGTGNRAALPFPMPPVPPKKSKMEQAIENARKPDCRDAYKALGLAAVVPLIANEFGEGTCRW